MVKPKLTMWDEVYGQEEYVYGKEPNQFIKQSLNSKGTGRVVCLAEGEGRNAVYLAGHGYEVTAVDSSAIGAAKCKALAEERGVNVKTVIADLADYQHDPESLDGVLMVFGHFPRPLRQHILTEAVKGLKKGGFLAMEVYSKEQLKYGTGGPPVPEMLYSLDELQKDIGQYFDFEIFRQIEREVVEGTKHDGLASVIQVYGKKRA